MRIIATYCCVLSKGSWLRGLVGGEACEGSLETVTG